MRVITFVSLVIGLVAFATTAQGDEVTYTVRQTVTLGPLEAGKKEKIDWWISIPDDSPHQQVLDLSVASTPGSWKIVREGEEGNRFLYVQIENTEATSFDAVVDFTVHRRAVETLIDPDRAGVIDNSNRGLFTRELALDAPHMSVTAEVRKLADEACGDERNIAKQARLLLDKVASVADHYSKDPSKPNCGIGDAKDCMTNGGGCCTDLHSLFIAMARSRDIPARLQMGYRLLARNAGKVVDPGYRCWVEYFLPRYGWVCADIVEADAPDGLGKAVWFTGLTVERVWLNQGRNFLLPHDPTNERVNHMSIGHAEIDGTPARILPEGELGPQMSRKIRFERISAE